MSKLYATKPAKMKSKQTGYKVEGPITCSCKVQQRTLNTTLPPVCDYHHLPRHVIFVNIGGFTMLVSMEDVMVLKTGTSMLDFQLSLQRKSLS